MSIRIGILGYGNLGKGVESAIGQNPDLELTAVFTRRNPENVNVRTAGVKVLAAEELEHMQDQIDVLVLCGGSATDLPVQTPKYADMYNVVDSLDTHARIPEHFAAVDAAAKKAGKVGIISCYSGRHSSEAGSLRQSGQASAGGISHCVPDRVVG